MHVNSTSEPLSPHKTRQKVSLPLEGKGDRRSPLRHHGTLDEIGQVPQGYLGLDRSSRHGQPGTRTPQRKETAQGRGTGLACSTLSLLDEGTHLTTTFLCRRIKTDGQGECIQKTSGTVPHEGLVQ